ncbi:MAG: hypothetical protein KY468_11200 [Armatimonadetes bacterium]|nr:hypothetical protein [Armatimonadota bacterium]
MLLTLSSPYAEATTLSIRGSQFLVNGKPTFLLGMSYYAGAGAPEAFVREDFKDQKRRGFDWVRVWATWNAFGSDVSAVDAEGRARQPSLDRLLALVKEADRQGLIVDVSLTRGEPVFDRPTITTQAAHLRAVETLSQALKPYKNVYIDLANERSLKDQRFTSFADLRELRDRVKRVDPNRLVTASSSPDIPEAEMKEYLITANLDFLSPHRPRGKESIAQTEAQTRDYLRWMKTLGKVVPLHYQEPFRRGFPFRGEGGITADDFIRDAVTAKRGGAAGWCLHNGDERPPEDHRPRRSFDLRKDEGRLFEQLDSIEREAADRLADALKRVEARE